MYPEIIQIHTIYRTDISLFSVHVFYRTDFVPFYHFSFLSLSLNFCVFIQRSLFCLFTLESHSIKYTKYIYTRTHSKCILHFRCCYVHLDPLPEVSEQMKNAFNPCDMALYSIIESVPHALCYFQ